jgi:hypothetical protein
MVDIFCCFAKNLTFKIKIHLLKVVTLVQHG